MRFCRFTAGKPDDGDDLYQDTMLYLMDHYESFDTTEDSVKGLAMSIAIFLWKSRKRKLARRMHIVPTDSLEVLSEGGVEIKDQSDMPEEITVHKEMIENLRSAITELPEKYRLPLLLHYLSEMQIREIGKTLKLPEPTVKTRLRRAKEMLRREMGKYEGR